MLPSPLKYRAIAHVTPAVDDQGISQGFGYVRFTHASDAQRAFEFTAKLPLVIDNIEMPTVLIPQPMNNRRLHVSGYKGSRQSLKQVFHKYYDTGRIKSIQISESQCRWYAGAVLTIGSTSPS